MKKWTVFLALFLLALLEATLFSRLKVFGVAPDLLLAGVVILSFMFRLPWLLIFAAFAGLLKDILGIHYYGLNIILFSAWGLASLKLSKNFFLTHFFLLPLAVFTVVLANNIATQIIFIYWGEKFFIGTFIKNIILQPLYSALLSILMFRLLKDAGYLHKL